MSHLDNVPWSALKTEHSHLAICAGRACRYAADVAPFAGTPDLSAPSMRDLLSLLKTDEILYLLGERPAPMVGMSIGEPYPAIQMVAAERTPASRRAQPSGLIAKLGQADADAMVALTTLAFPGFFRRGTYQMGVYYGIRVDGELVAMAGERMRLPGYREVSGVCTHPAHTGKGHAAHLITYLMVQHAETALQSMLHVGAGNVRALRLYERLGFVVRRQMNLHPISLSKFQR